MARRRSSSAQSGTTLFRNLPFRSALCFYTGVFALFGPLGVLIGSSFAQDRQLWKTLYWIALGGVVGVLWAMGGTLGRKWFIPAGIASAFYGFSWGAGFPAALAIDATAPNLGTLLYVALFVLSYVLFVVFISIEGTKRLRLQAEIDLAGEIHTVLVPEIDRDLEGVRILGVSEASSEMGGDLIDLVEGARGDVEIYIADVSGHGVKAGIVMAMVKSALRMRLLESAPLESVLSDLNRTLCAVTSGEMFCTLACVRLDASRRRAECAVAGHPPIMLRRGASDRVERIESGSLPLGVHAGESFTTTPIDLEEGDTLALYTDGFIETRSPSGELFGLDRIESLVGSSRQGDLNDVADGIREAIHSYAGGAPRADDESLILMRITPRPGIDSG